MIKFERLERKFFNRETKTVAKDLIGRYIVRVTEKGNIVAKVIEVEAYLGPRDKACHSYNYKKTEKTKIMYMRPGTLYVYLIYGLYYCLNVITEQEGNPCAVLIRQSYPIDGIEIMKEFRTVKRGKNLKNLMDGPGKLCMAMDITKEKFNGADSCALDSKLYFIQGENVDEKDIIIGKRIGIDYAEEDKDFLLRYTLGSKN